MTKDQLLQAVAKQRTTVNAKGYNWQEDGGEQLLATLITNLIGYIGDPQIISAVKGFLSDASGYDVDNPPGFDFQDFINRSSGRDTMASKSRATD